MEMILISMQLKRFSIKKLKRIWLTAGVSVTGVVVIAVVLNSILPFNRNNHVYGVEKASPDVKAYHGNVDANATVTPSEKPRIQVPVDLKVEENEQKSVDAGHSPWKLDPVYVAQVFVSLKISPEGIQGEYPVKYEEFKIIYNTGKDAIIGVGGSKTPIKKVYLKKLIRQDYTGIWTVVGYDPIGER